MKVEIYKDEKGEWRWTKRAANGEVIADSGEGYVNYAHARRMAVREAAGADVVVRQNKD